MSTHPTRGRRVDFLAIVAATFAVWAIVRWVVYAYPQLGDTRVYQHAARMIDAGFVPYRDFDVEYPPLAVGVFWLLDRVPGPSTTMFSLAMALCLAATGCAAWVTSAHLGLSRARRLAAVIVVCLLPLLLGTLLQTRYDLLLSALLAWMLVAALARRFGWMWVLAALAAAIKLVPLILVPVLAIWHARHRGTARAGGGVAGFAAIVAATLVPFAIIAPSGLWELFRYHLVRPLQMESLGSSLIHALGLPYRQVQSYGSDNISGTLPQLASTASTALLAVVLMAVIVLVARSRELERRPELFVTAVAATLLAAVVLGKVLSPQYLAWLAPVLLLVPTRYGAAAAATFVLALPVTQLVFPLLYTDLVVRAAPLPVWLLALRNALLVAALVLVAVALRRDASAKTAKTSQPVLSSSTGA